MNTRDLIIIGGGPAGLTAAIYAARAQLKPLIVAGALPGGQLMLTREIENFPGFDEPILGSELMARMRRQAERYGTDIINEDVTTADFSTRPFKIMTASGAHIARAVIIATGAAAKWLNVPNEKKFVGRGVHTCATCDGYAYRGKHVAVIGGGDAAMEEALALAELDVNVTIIHRRDTFKASEIMAKRVLAHPKINVRWNAAVEEIIGTDNFAGIRVKDTMTGATEELTLNGIFLAIGRTPATAFLQGQIELDALGYVVARNRTQSSVDGVFVAGDAEDRHYRQAITAAADGCKAAIDAKQWLGANAA
ncbi:MAG: thioredoxin-disulfide reductase [Candidatus Uhrbacteria bacterium]